MLQLREGDCHTQVEVSHLADPVKYIEELKMASAFLVSLALFPFELYSSPYLICTLNAVSPTSLGKGSLGK